METENKTMSRLVGLAVTLTVAIIMIASLVVPVISDATDHTTNEHNLGIAIRSINDNSDVTITYDDTTPGVYVVNGSPANMLNANYATLTADTFALRVSSNVLYLNVFNQDNTYVSTLINSMDVTLSNGVMSGSINGNSVSLAYNYAYYVDNAGNFIMTNLSDNATVYVNSDSVMYCDARYNSTFWVCSGSIANGFKVVAMDGTEYEGHIHYTQLEGYHDLYAVSSITVCLGDGSTMTLTRFIAPAYVDATTIDNHSQDSVYWIIPVILITALIAMTVNSYRLKNQ